MSEVERLSVVLPADMAAIVRGKVAEGRYASSSELIRDALRAWMDEESRREQRLVELRAMIDEADAEDDPPLTDMEVAAHFEKRFRQSLRDRGEDA